jgi:hypothetical protein
MSMTRWINWNNLLWLGFALMFAAAVYVTVLPDKWDRAVAVKVCGGLLVVKRDDGSLWLLREWGRPYRIEDLDQLACG